MTARHGAQTRHQDGGRHAWACTCGAASPPGWRYQTARKASIAWAAHVAAAKTSTHRSEARRD